MALNSFDEDEAGLAQGRMGLSSFRLFTIPSANMCAANGAGVGNIRVGPCRVGLTKGNASDGQCAPLTGLWAGHGHLQPGSALGRQSKWNCTTLGYPHGCTEALVSILSPDHSAPIDSLNCMGGSASRKGSP